MLSQLSPGDQPLGPDSLAHQGCSPARCTGALNSVSAGDPPAHQAQGQLLQRRKLWQEKSQTQAICSGHGRRHAPHQCMFCCPACISFHPEAPGAFQIKSVPARHPTDGLKGPRTTCADDIAFIQFQDTSSSRREAFGHGDLQSLHFETRQLHRLSSRATARAGEAHSSDDSWKWCHHQAALP